MPPPRTTAAADVALDASNVSDFTANGETGPKGGGTFGVLPGGEDDLASAWAVFKLQLAGDDRPVSLSFGAAPAVLPGGEDDLDSSYWLGTYSFSQASWEWLDPPAGSGDPLRPGAWNAVGTVEIPLNSAELRQRYCNLGGEVYFCVLVEPKVRAGTWCGITVQPSTLATLDKSDAGYFRTQPLPSGIDSALGNGTTVTLTVPPAEPLEADRTYIERRETGGTSSAAKGVAAAGGGWQALGYLPRGVVTYVDPADNADPPKTMPKAGKQYEYRATAAILEGNRAYRSRHSHSMPGKLQGWTSFILRTGTNSDPCLLDVNGNPAVAYVNSAGPSLTYVRADTLDGAASSDWTTGISGFAPGGGGTDIQPTLAMVVGRPALAWRNPVSGQIEYAWASHSTGMTPWNAKVLVSPGVTGHHPSLAVIQGKPAVAYFDGGAQRLNYAASLSVNGVDQADWTGFVALGPGGVALHPALAEINPGVDPHPAIAMGNGIPSTSQSYYLAATSGGTPGDWSFRNLNSLFQPGWCNTLLLVDGRPAMSYYCAGDGSVNYWHANNVDGAAPANWQACVTIEVGADVPDAAGGNLAVVANKPVIAYSEGGILKIARASDPANPGFEGDTLDDWQVETTAFETTGKIAIAQIAGGLAMTWVDAGSGSLYYGIEQ